MDSNHLHINTEVCADACNDVYKTAQLDILTLSAIQVSIVCERVRIYCSV